MIGIPGLYFVIVRDDRARFVRPDPENRLHTIEVVDLASLEERAGEAPGDLTSGPDPPGLRDAAPNAFLRRLAARINEDFAVDLFSHLVLAAPPNVLAELAFMLDTPTRDSLYGSLARDLFYVPDLELWPNLLPWIQPTHINWAPTAASREQ
jgi:hypothetical protein